VELRCYPAASPRAVTDRLYSELGEIHKVPPAGSYKAMRIALYWILFLGQTIGDTTILSHLIPLFRQLVTSGLHEKTPPKILVFATLGVTMIQVCYWLAQCWFTTLRLGHNSLLGHVILFLSRLNFIFAAAVFSAVYLVRFNELELEISLWGFALLFGVLFSIFCYTLELERLGRALIERKDRS
jgi:hypothetical protein